MEFLKQDDLMNEVQKDLEGEPGSNVIDRNAFATRVEKVFDILYEKLARSFGPGGAGTFISVFPNYLNTKDGFTIMKYIQFDKKLDMVICNMVSDICNRLNFTVGDGTTTAVIATESTYKNYCKNKDYFESQHLLPRDILYKLEGYKTKILEGLSKSAVSIRSTNPLELKQNIEKVVYISSNGNREITDMISDLYSKLMYPAISSTISDEGTTKAYIIDGYKIDVSLTDKMYINNDNQTMHIDESDYIIFDHTVTQDTYKFILKPLADACKIRGRHLICIAPFYDEQALKGVIAPDLNREYKQTHNISLVLTVCNKTTGHSKIILNDFAMLMHTPMITSLHEKDIIEKIKANGDIYKVFNLDCRQVPNMNVAVKQMVGDEEQYTIVPWNETIDGCLGEDNVEYTIALGYCDGADIGLKDSVFKGFHYDRDEYKKYCKDAEEEMNSAQRKAEANGTFSLDLIQKQQRYYSLSLKTGVIEVGTSSELTRGYLKDSVDDAIRAAASAFNNGTVLGCNVTTIKVIDQILSETTDEIDKMLLTILKNGFRDVYRTVLTNVFEDINYTDDKTAGAASQSKNFIETLHTQTRYRNYEPVSINVLDFFQHNREVSTSIHDIIIDYSVFVEKVFNLETGNFEKNVINSAETDKEIVKAVIDLLSLLITGNQIVMD